MRGRERSHKRHAVESRDAVDGSKRRPESPAAAERWKEVGDVRFRAVDATDEAVVEVEIGGAGEPMASGDDDVIERRDLSGPVWVEPVEVHGERRLL